MLRYIAPRMTRAVVVIDAIFGRFVDLVDGIEVVYFRHAISFLFSVNRIPADKWRTSRDEPDSLGTAAVATSRLQLPLLRNDRQSVLPVRGEARSAFSVKMEKTNLFAGCLLRSSVNDLQFVCGPDVFTTHD